MIVTLPKHPSGLALLNPDRIIYLADHFLEHEVTTVTVDGGDDGVVEFQVKGTPGDVAYDINSQVAAS